MKVKKHLIFEQSSQKMQTLAVKNGTTLGICGFVTCALVEHLANCQNFTPQKIKQLNQNMMAPKIEDAMKYILFKRKLQLKKFYKLMGDNDRKKYLKDWVANYEIAQFIEDKFDSFRNKQVYFFRQSAYDHPEEVEKVQWEERERVTQEQPFKGQLYFYNSFGPYKSNFKHEFQAVLKASDPSKPVIIATDIFGHFYTVILWQGEIHILDTLSSYMQKDYDSPIVQCIAYNYKLSMKP